MTTPVYPFDQTGLAATNLVTNEIQTLITPNPEDFYFIIPSRIVAMSFCEPRS